MATKLHEMNADAAISYVAGLQEAPEMFHTLLKHEQAHPRYPGGRKTVKDAIQERIGETLTASSDGLARGPAPDPYAEADAPQPPVPPMPAPGTRLLVTDASGMTHDAVAVKAEMGLVVRLKTVPPAELFVRSGDGAAPLTFRVP